MKNKNMVRKNKPSILTICIFILLLIYALSIFALLGWGLLTSFKSTDDFSLFGNILGWPNTKWDDGYALRFGNYRSILSSFSFRASDSSYYSSIFGYIQNSPDKMFGFKDFFINSFVYALICSGVYTLVSVTVAYMCQKYPFKFSKLLYVVMLIIMTIPIVGSYPSMIELTRNLGIYDTYLGMIILNFNFTGLYFFVFYAFMQGLPNAYIEAAEIDGASQFETYVRIILPLAGKIIMTVWLLKFIAVWNDYQTPLLYYPNHPTLSYAVFRMTNMTTGDNRGMDVQGVPQKVAGCMILVAPILTLFVVFQDKLTGNLTMGGIKG